MTTRQEYNIDMVDAEGTKGLETEKVRRRGPGYDYPQVNGPVLGAVCICRLIIQDTGGVHLHS